MRTVAFYAWCFLVGFAYLQLGMSAIDAMTPPAIDQDAGSFPVSKPR